MEAAHFSTDALEVLVDADLGKALGMLLAGIIEHLPLYVDVVRPILGFEKGRLGEARPYGSDHEGH